MPPRRDEDGATRIAVLRLFYIKRWTARRIARQLDISTQAVNYHVRRLAEEFEQKAEEDQRAVNRRKKARAAARRRAS